MNSLNSFLDSATKAVGTVKNAIAPSTATPAPTVSVSVPAQKTNWPLIGGIAGGVLLLVGALIFFGRKSKP